jgi:uncharacterized protein (DUF58 family)
MLRLKAAGKTLILSAAALALLYGLFQDPILLLTAAAAAALAFYSLCAALWKMRQLKRLAVKPDHVELRLVAGTTQAVEVKIESAGQAVVFVEHPLSFCRVKPQPCKVNEALALEFSPSLAGVYEADWLEVEADAPFKAYAVRVQLPFKTSLTVLPMVVPAAVRALELLAAMGATAYEVPVQAIGRGTEYAETREYAAGDDLRRVDWKATARLQKLMVKQFHEDAGGAVNLIYDLKAAGPVTRDEAAAEFLTAATALTAQATPYTITLVDEQNRLKTMKFRDARTALLTAVKTALKAVQVDYGILYELVEPQAMKEALMLLKLMDQTVEEKALLLAEAADTIAVTCLLGDLTWLMDVHEALKARDRRLMLYAPSRIWLDSETLEQAYIDYERQVRLMAKLKRLGIEVRHIEALEKAYVMKSWA